MCLLNNENSTHVRPCSMILTSFVGFGDLLGEEFVHSILIINLDDVDVNKLLFCNFVPP